MPSDPASTLVNGMFTAPGTCPAVNSAGDRTSRTTGASPRAIRSSSATGEIAISLTSCSAEPSLVPGKVRLGLGCRLRLRSGRLHVIANLLVLRVRRIQFECPVDHWQRFLRPTALHQCGGKIPQARRALRTEVGCPLRRDDSFGRL